MRFGYLAQYMEYVEKIQNKKLVLFGAGDNLHNVMMRYYRYDDIFAIWDNNPSKQGRKVMNITVTSPQFMSDVVVIITVLDELAICAITSQLYSLGIKDVYPAAALSLTNEIERYNQDFSQKYHELNAYSVVEQNRDKIAQVRALLSDEKSRIVYDKIVENTQYNIGDYMDVCDDIYDHYFSDGFFAYTNEEVFIDGGAYIGEDTVRLARQIGIENMKRAYCFEPDTGNYTRCLQNLKSFFACEEAIDSGECCKGDRFSVYKSGLYDRNENIGFISYGTHASVFAELRKGNASSTVPAMMIDDIIQPDDIVTLIKMDIEGAEMPALRGGERIIKEHKPKMAICIYHNIEDLWEIPLYLHALVPSYKLYIRHHTPQFWDSVVYATV